MRVPINMGVKGKVTATLTNTETGEKQEVKGDNLILNHYLDWAMERGLGILGDTTFNRCYIGTSDIPPQPTDTTFVGTQLAMSASSVLVKTIKDVNQGPKIEQVNLIQGIGVSDYNSLAVTPDENILIVGINGDAVDLPGLRAFLIDKTSWTLTSLQVDAFAELANLDCRALSIGGEYLFVGLGSAPWGKLFKRNGNNFGFVANTPELLNTALDSDISSGGNYLIACSSNRAVLYEIIDNSIVELLTTSPSSVNAVGFSPSGERFFVASGAGSSSSSNGYLYIYKQEGQTYSLEFTHSQTGDYSRVASAAFVSDNSLVLMDRYGRWTNNYALRRLDYNTDTGNWDEKLTIDLHTSTSWEQEYDKLDCFTGRYILLSGYRALWAPLVGLVYINTDAPPAPVLYKSTALLNNAGVFFTRVRRDDGYSHIGVYRIQSNPQNIQSYARQWTFPAGVGTGIVNLVGLQANSATGSAAGSAGDNRHVAQIFLPEPLEKTDLHQLDVIWEIEVENPGVWEGVIPGGSRDGSNLAWRVTINEKQFYDLVQTGYRILANWFGVTGTPNVRIGTSNEESDLIFDRANIRGKQIQYISSTAISVVNPYVPGSLKRTIRLFLEVDQGNGQIGEIVLGGSESANSLVRITFDPPLDKPPDVGEGADPYRIYLDLEIGWQRG